MSEPKFTSFAELPSVRVNELVQVQTLNGERAQLCRFVTSPDATTFPPVSHEAEQLTLVVRGRLRLRLGDAVHEVGPGSVFFIPSGVEHEATILEAPVEVIDFHAPPREELR